MDKTVESLPPILALGIDTPIGLTLIRELGERKVPVYGIAHSADSIGLASRYLTKGFIHAGGNDELIQLINEIAENNNVRFLMTISEQRILFLQNNLHRLPNIVPLIPNATIMQTVLNKDEVYQLAQKIGINTPKDYIVVNENLPKDICFPVILKWANPNAIIPLLNKHEIPFIKCEYCYSKKDLLTALARYRLIEQQPLIQSYCSGYGLGQMIYLHQGEPVLRFQHKRIHEWPPEGGFSTLCESIDLVEHKALFNQSIELLQAVKWEGPAMVEYRFNPETGEAMLMEINGRFWGSLPLAYYAGAHFVWMHYSVHVLRNIPPPTKVLVGVCCMFFIPELKRMLTLIFRSNSIQDKTFIYNMIDELQFFFKHYINGQFFYVFNWHDPKPFLVDIFKLSIGRLRNFRSLL